MGSTSPTANRHELDGGRGHPLLAVALVALLLAGGAVAWFQARDKVGDQADSADRQVRGGAHDGTDHRVGRYRRGPRRYHGNYNETKPVVRDHCVTVQVRPGDSKVTLDGLRGQWGHRVDGRPPRRVDPAVVDLGSRPDQRQA